MARLDLHLVPTHPDRSGGLGGLGVVHVALAPLMFGGTAILVADLANSFQIVRSMGVAPIALLQILLLAVVAALPAVPLVLFVVPLDTLIVEGVKKFLNL